MKSSHGITIGAAVFLVLGLAIFRNGQPHDPSTPPPARNLPADRAQDRPTNTLSPASVSSKLDQNPRQLVSSVFSSAVSNRLETLIVEQTAMLEATRGLEGNALRAAAGLIRLFQERELDELLVTFPKESRRDLQAALDRRVTIPDGYPAPTHPSSPPPDRNLIHEPP